MWGGTSVALRMIPTSPPTLPTALPSPSLGSAPWRHITCSYPDAGQSTDILWLTNRCCAGVGSGDGGQGVGAEMEGRGWAHGHLPPSPTDNSEGALEGMVRGLRQGGVSLLGQPQPLTQEQWRSSFMRRNRDPQQNELVHRVRALQSTLKVSWRALGMVEDRAPGLWFCFLA